MIAEAPFRLECPGEMHPLFRRFIDGTDALIPTDFLGLVSGSGTKNLIFKVLVPILFFLNLLRVLVNTGTKKYRLRLALNGSVK